MHKKLLLITLACTTILASGFAVAASTDHFMGNDNRFEGMMEELSDRLDLNEAQTAEITAIFKASFDEWRKNRDGLEKMMKTDHDTLSKADMDKLMAQHTQLQVSRNQFIVATLAKTHAVLSPEQRETTLKLLTERNGASRHGGRRSGEYSSRHGGSDCGEYSGRHGGRRSGEYSSRHGGSDCGEYSGRHGGRGFFHRLREYF